MVKRFFVVISLLSFIFILQGCGGYDAPETATITINPSSVKITDGTSGVNTTTQYFIITVKDENGIPLKNVEVWISYLWAAPNAYDFVQLYDGDDAEDSPMNVTTDENGAYNLRFDFKSGGGLEYSADLEVSSGSVYNSAEFKVETGS